MNPFRFKQISNSKIIEHKLSQEKNGEIWHRITTPILNNVKTIWINNRVLSVLFEFEHQRMVMVWRRF